MGVALRVRRDCGGGGRCREYVVNMRSDRRWGCGGSAEPIACVEFGVVEDLRCATAQVNLIARLAQRFQR